jgi:uncharacterized membrane protein
MDDQQAKIIIEQLQKLNKSVDKQNSIRHMFNVGVVYGIGFFIGSAVIATIALGIIGPIAGKISWLRNSFQAGQSLTPRPQI